jgi:hypothetical protein
MGKYTIESDPGPGPIPDGGGDEYLVLANRARVARGVHPFVWDEDLFRCGMEAIRNNWDMHEHFGERSEKYGASAEGSFPEVSGPGFAGIMDKMLNHPKLSKGAHAAHFFDPRHTRVGIAYGGDGPTSDGPFYVIVYGT